MSLQFPIVFVRQKDSQLSQDETMGTKSKFWFKHPELGRCLYKQIRPNTGEDWAEKIASELSELLGLPQLNQVKYSYLQIGKRQMVFGLLEIYLLVIFY